MSTTSPTAVPASPVFTPGTRVRITTQMARQEQTLSSSVEGTVVSHQQKPTGSWFAHGKNDKLWLDRLTVRKADGEMFVSNLDQLTRVEVLGQ